MSVTNSVPIYNDSKYGVSNDTQVAAKKNDTMEKEDFLMLLIAQLKNQDPLNPMKDTEFIAQLATFSSLEQSRATARSTEQAAAAGMIGKVVSDEYNNTGMVTEVSMDDKGTHLSIAVVQTDRDGNIVFDNDGNMVYEYEKGKNGQVVLDGKGNPVLLTKVVDYSNIKEIKNPYLL
ncbi:MAG: flagellar hook assembly protein FlgD [Nitrospirota bacterium]